MSIGTIRKYKKIYYISATLFHFFLTNINLQIAQNPIPLESGELSAKKGMTVL